MRSILLEIGIVCSHSIASCTKCTKFVEATKPNDIAAKSDRHLLQAAKQGVKLPCRVQKACLVFG